MEPARIESTVLYPDVAFADRDLIYRDVGRAVASQRINRVVAAERAARATLRRAANVRPGGRRSIGLFALRTARAGQQSAAQESARQAALEDATLRAAAAERPATAARLTGRSWHFRQIAKIRQRQPTQKIRQAGASVRPTVRRSVVTRHATAKRGQRVMRLGNGMTAVIAYARSQLGKSYVTGGEGPGGFDCSGFTKRAYARAGLRLPHSSIAQAARARFIPRAVARPGDLVVGSRHVGIYMGRGMMIDAGNHRTGVIYRRLYNGLRVARF